MHYSFLTASVISVVLLVATLVSQMRRGAGFGKAVRQPLSVIFGILFVAFLGLALKNAQNAAQSGTSPIGVQNGSSGTAPSTAVLPGNISLARLESLSNYSYTEVNSGGGRSMTISGNVYSADNWETTISSMVIRYIGTTSYAKLGKWYASKGIQTPPLSEYAGQFLKLATNPALRLREGGSCNFANTAGHVWTVVNTNFNILLISACIADQSGALLQSSESKNMGSTFTITAIGTVRPFTVPSPVVGN